MHIVFINPQGNFDAADSHLTEHPDFGGQLVYVKELAMAMADEGHRIDIVTRLIDDPEWPEFSSPLDHYPGYESLVRIVRIRCGGAAFLAKERLWPHLDEFVHNLVAFYGNTLPAFATAHYADGGYCAAQLKHLTGIDFSFTGHSLGAQKIDKLGMNAENMEAMERRFHFSRRIDAERLAMERACKIITSTAQERDEQYAHPLYVGAVDSADTGRFDVIPPGVNLGVFNDHGDSADKTIWRGLDERLRAGPSPWVLVSSRLDEKKNILGIVRAYAGSAALQQRSNLAICMRGIDDPYRDVDLLPGTEQAVLRPILDAISDAGIRDRVRFLNIPSQKALAAAYRYFARRGSVFALTAFYEPFGLAPIEAAACGLACVATRNGGPAEIFADGSGVLVDPFDTADIARGLLQALKDAPSLAWRGRRRVIETYTWAKTAQGYLAVAKSGAAAPGARGEAIPELDASARLRAYLENKDVLAASSG